MEKHEDLYAFLHPTPIEHELIVVSERFKGKDGKPIAWEIKAVMQDESDMIRKEFTKVNKKGEKSFDSVGYGRAIIARAVVFPDLNSAELQSHYGVLGADRLPSAMLSSGEYATLSNAVLKISNLNDDLSEDVEEAKNE